MNNQFIPYEQALKLKELGFDEECFSCYFSNGDFSGFFHSYDVNSAVIAKIQAIPAPLWQQAFDWFREEHNLMGIVGYHKNGQYSYLVETIKNHKTIIVEDAIKTYQEAQLACLDKLIEIVEQK